MYKLGSFETVFNVDTKTNFKMESGNPDYEAYKLWLAEGNTPEPADPVPVMGW